VKLDYVMCLQNGLHWLEEEDKKEVKKKTINGIPSGFPLFGRRQQNGIVMFFLNQFVL
jgi:hypothetical protein